MFRFLAAGFLTRQLARQLYRLTPNPVARAAGVAVAGLFVTRMLSGKSRRR